MAEVYITIRLYNIDTISSHVVRKVKNTLCTQDIAMIIKTLVVSGVKDSLYLDGYSIA